MRGFDVNLGASMKAFVVDDSADNQNDFAACLLQVWPDRLDETELAVLAVLDMN